MLKMTGSECLVQVVVAIIMLYNGNQYQASISLLYHFHTYISSRAGMISYTHKTEFCQSMYKNKFL